MYGLRHLLGAVALAVALIAPSSSLSTLPAPASCGSERVTGPNCRTCVDPRFASPSCDTCLLDRHTGPACRDCTDPRRSAPDCLACDKPFTGDDCGVCVAPSHVGAMCERCEDERRQWPGCSACRDGWAGPDCGVCADRALAWPQCDAPAPTRPRRVLLIGASSMHWTFGRVIERRLVDAFDVEVRNAAYSATGLSRPDYIDLTARAEEHAENFAPDLLIAHFGENDCQAMVDPGGAFLTRAYGKPWLDEFGRRVEDVARRMNVRGVPVLFVGPQNMYDGRRSRCLAQLADAIHRVARDTGNGWVDTRAWTSDADDHWTQYVDVGGERVRTQNDGVHFTWALAEHIADDIVRWLEGPMRFDRPMPLHASHPRDDAAHRVDHDVPGASSAPIPRTVTARTE